MVTLVGFLELFLCVWRASLHKVLVYIMLSLFIVTSSLAELHLLPVIGFGSSPEWYWECFFVVVVAFGLAISSIPLQQIYKVQDSFIQQGYTNECLLIKIRHIDE